MLKEYPHFKKGEVETIFQGLTKREKSQVEEYLKYRQARGAGTEKFVGDIKRYITHIRYVFEKPFEKINLKDIRDFLALVNSTKILSGSSKNNLKADLKNFLKWKFKDWSNRFSELEDISYSRNVRNEEKINPSAILKKEDIEDIMKHESKMFWKAFFITQYEAGLRTKETRFLKWADIKFNVDEEISEISIFATKTNRARTVFVKEATHYLKLLKQEQENLNQKGVYVFHLKKDVNKPVDKGTISIWARGLSKKSGKYFWNYLLRHSRATELYTLADENKISENTAAQFMGHNKSMKETYLHLDKDKIKKMLKEQVYKLEELPPKEKREFEEKLEKQGKELENIKKNQEAQQKEIERRNDYDSFLNDLLSLPQVQKMINNKKKLDVKQNMMATGGAEK